MNHLFNIRLYLPKCLAFLLLFFCLSIESRGQLASWTTTTLNTNPSGALSATSLATNVASAAISRVGLAVGGGNARYNSTAWNSANNYLQITITAATGYSMNLSGQNFVFSCGSSNTGPSVVKLYSSVDNYTVSIGTLNSSTGTATNTVILPSSAAYTGLTTITFRIKNESSVSANNGTVASGGTFGPSLLTVNGSVAAPATAPVVTTTRATTITFNSIVTGGNVTSNGGSVLTGKGIAWGTATNPTSTISTTGTSTGTYNTSITSLLPNSDYFYRAYATNTVGTSYGVNYDTTTLAALPNLLVDHNTVHPESSMDVVIDENGNPDGIPASENTTEYAIFENTTSTWLQANGTLGATVVWLSNAACPESITGLSPFTQYCFQIKARNANNKETALSTQTCLTTQGLSGTISDISGNTIAPFCNGSANTFTLNYNSTLSSGIYTAQLSSASGSFATPVSVGSSTSATAIQVTVPSGTASGTGYKLRVINSSTISDSTAAFIVKASPSGTLTTNTPLICPGQEATAKLIFSAGANSAGPFDLSVKNVPGNITVPYSGIVSGIAFDINNTQLPAAGSNDYQLLQITSSNGCSNP